MALLVVYLAYYTILTPYPLYTCKQLYCFQRLFILNIFIRLSLQVIFIQAVTYSSLYILQRYLRGYYQSISDFLGVFFLVKFFNGVSLVSLQRQDSDVKGYPYRYMVCGQCLYVFQPAELQLVYQRFLYKYKVNYALLGSSFLGRFTS